MVLPQCVRVSAPAKVLLFGEHAVVYGCPSIATALTDLRLGVMIERVDENDSVIEFIFSDISDGENGALRRRYPCNTLAHIVKDVPRDNDSSFLPKPDLAILEQIDTLLAHELEEHVTTLRSAVYLFCALLHHSRVLTGTHGSLRIQVSADSFPIGAGLGSSAAFSVALAGALAQFREELPTSSEDQLALVNAFAYSAEVLLHGSPSGVDNTISALGGALVFRKLPTPSFERLSCELSSFRFLIVNTKVPRSTKQLVANVRNRYEANKEQTQGMFDEIEAIVDGFIQSTGDETMTDAMLGTQMEKNHELLNALGVGHPVIEQVVQICKPLGIWTKTTGAGGGGCTLSLLPQTLEDSNLIEMIQTLEARGFQVFVSSIGGAGLVIEN